MAIINYNPNTGAKLKKGETVTDKATGKKVTQGTVFGGSSGSSSGSNSSSKNSNPNNLNLYNPNTGQLLKPGETVTFNGQKVTQGTVFGSPGNYGYVPPSTNVIPTEKIGVNNQMNKAIAFPQAGNQENDYSWITSALSPNNADGTPKNAQQIQTDQSNTNLAYLRSLMEPAPTSEESYRRAQEETGILKKQQLVSDLSGKLDAITAAAEANKLRVIGQGRGIPEAIIGGQQAQIAREAAIEALPVAAQLNAAQGNLQMAEQNLNTLFKIYSDDATNKYNQKQKVNEAFYSILTGVQKTALDKIEKAETRAYNEQLQDQQDAKEYAKIAFSNNQATLGSQIMALNPKSPTYRTDVAELSSKIYDSKYELERQRIRDSLNSAGNVINGSIINPKVLSTTQFKNAQAAQNLKNTLQKAVDAVNKYGNKERISGTGKGILDTLKVQLRSEISTALEQGVVQPGEAEAFDSIAGQLNKSFFIRNKKTLGSLSSLLSSMDSRINTQKAALTNTYNISPEQIDTLLGVTNLSDQEFFDMDALLD